jgi:hypothetical protein
MGTTQTLPAPAAEMAEQSALVEEQEAGIEQALVPSPPSFDFPEPIVLSPQLARLPVELDVSVSVRGFRVRNLLALEAANLIESGWGHGEDLPLAAGGVQLAWCEFEVIGTLLAVRVTRLA